MTQNFDSEYYASTSDNYYRSQYRSESVEDNNSLQLYPDRTYEHWNSCCRDNNRYIPRFAGRPSRNIKIPGSNGTVDWSVWIIRQTGS